MFKKKSTRRSPNILFGLFRLILSLSMFAVLLLGIFSAYKHFSGTDPLKINPKSLTDLAMQLISQATPKLSQKVLGQKIEPPKEEYKINNTVIPQSSQTPKPKPAAKFVMRFMLIADSENDNAHLKQALDQAKHDFKDIKFVVGLGDFTEVGTVDELKLAKKNLDESGLRYFVLPGDHDLWDSRNRSLEPTTDFNSVFGPSFQSFTLDNFKFILLDNSDNYTGFGDDQISWVAKESSTKDLLGTYVFLHEPLFHPSSDHFMGRVEPKLKTQAQNMTAELANAKVKKIFAGDTHYFSEYEEPQTKLPMVTVGAITLQNNLQNPRFAIVSLYDDGSSDIQDIEVRTQ